MATDTPTSSQGATAAAAPAAAAARGGGLRPAAPGTPHCNCGTPMHPDHIEMHRGTLLERYACPRRRWWNFPMHPHSWMTPRDPVTHHHD